jgi:hypothetical protein
MECKMLERIKRELRRQRADKHHSTHSININININNNINNSAIDSYVSARRSEGSKYKAKHSRLSSVKKQSLLPLILVREGSMYYD